MRRLTPCRRESLFDDPVAPRFAHAVPSSQRPVPVPVTPCRNRRFGTYRRPFRREPGSVACSRMKRSRVSQLRSAIRGEAVRDSRRPITPAPERWPDTSSATETGSPSITAQRPNPMPAARGPAGCPGGRAGRRERRSRESSARSGRAGSGTPRATRSSAPPGRGRNAPARVRRCTRAAAPKRAALRRPPSPPRTRQPPRNPRKLELTH